MPITETAVALAGLRWVASPVVKELVKKSISYLGTDITKGLEDLETILLPQFQLTIEAAQHSPHKAKLSRWLARLKNAYFDAEGILHELEYERLKRMAKGQDKKLLVRLSSKPIIKPLAKVAGRVVKKASLLSPQKRKLLKRLNKLIEIAAEAKTFRELMGIQNTKSTQNDGDNPFVTTSLLGNADKVFGRDGDREEIINFLLNKQGDSSSSTKSYSVVMITGMGGAGKTTLARYVYNDPEVQNYFDVKMWLHLSQKFDIIEVTKDMIECASGKCPDLCNLNNLQVELVKQLHNKKVMVVLDDIWYENNDGVAEKKQWENLLKPFDSRGGICKIMVTSRSSWSFPVELQPGKIIPLGDLAPDDFKSLLRYHAIDSLQISNPQMKNYLSDMSHMVDQIVKKMSKLPLAAKVVGNQLRERPEISFWQDTLEKVNLSDIMDILLWSFHRFDVQLQRCFLFCSIFPKNTIFPSADDLVPYWVALDFIQPSDDHNNSVEEICLKYFQKMVANSIFQLVDKVYHMHDLFYDLAEKLSVGDCFRVTNVEREIPSTVQHVFLKVNNEILKEKLSSICNLSNLRTLILGNPFIDNISEIISKISTKNFRNLRVLDVWSRGYKTVPRVVGDFRNLRLLHFTRSSIEALPDSVLQLYHLQFLILPSSVKTLPTKLSNLIKLQRIDMYSFLDNGQVYTLPPVPYLGKLASLQRLNEFHVRKEEGYELQQLGHLKEIGRSLRIVNLENVTNKNEAVEARLIDKRKLKKLELVWAKSAENGLEVEVIEALRPPTNLEGLTIDGYRGSRYPTWLLEGSIIENIKGVWFYNCNALTILPPNFHQFRHCSELVLENLGALRELSTFPENLATLSIIKCPCLIFVCENELQVNENQSSFELFPILDQDTKDILDQELKSFEQTCSKENCEMLLHIMENSAEVNIVNIAWQCCHQQRMNFLFSLPPERAQANKLKLPSMLRNLDLGYCCVSDEALTDCLREMKTLEKLYLSGIMTITTLPPKEVLQSLQSLRVLEIKHCRCLRSLGGLHALPYLQHFLLRDCMCLEMGSRSSPLPPTLQTFIINKCIVPTGIFNGDLPCLQTVDINTCFFPESKLSIRKLTLLESLELILCFGLKTIEGLESRPFISTLDLTMLLDLDVESVLKSWQGCREHLYISSLVMMNKLLSSQDFVFPQWLSIMCCEQEAISFEKFDHLQSIKTLRFMDCKELSMIKALSYFSTLEMIVFINCPKILELPELPGSIQHIIISGCPVLRERCLPNGRDWHKIRSMDWLIV